jgi:hypothetical protein
MHNRNAGRRCMSGFSTFPKYYRSRKSTHEATTRTRGGNEQYWKDLVLYA